MRNSALKITVSTVFGLAFDVDRSSAAPSGFKPALTDLGSGKRLFGEARLRGFASLLRIGFADTLVLIGGDEGRFKGEEPCVNRAVAIRDMLVSDYGCTASRIRAIPSSSNTGGNIQIIRGELERQALDFEDYAVVNSHYHLPRTQLDLIAAGVLAQMFSAEAFWLLEGQASKDMLIATLGGGPLAERMSEEIHGVCDKIRGSYKPRTDVVAGSA
jgi:hypothetical protein